MGNTGIDGHILCVGNMVTLIWLDPMLKNPQLAPQRGNFYVILFYSGNIINMIRFGWGALDNYMCYVCRFLISPCISMVGYVSFSCPRIKICGF